MKKLWKILIPTFLLCLCILLLPTKASAASSFCLDFKLNSDGDSYSVSHCENDAKGELVIPATYNGKPVTSIGNSAFYFCRYLTSITIPNSVTSIGSSAFYYCLNLPSITIPNSVTSIGSSAFYYCMDLTSVIIPNSVTSIGSYAFSGCGKLEYNIYDNAKYLGNENNPYFILMNTTSKDITSCIIHPDTKMIDNYAFQKHSSLTSVTIPDSVTSIGEYAFSDCDSLIDITFGAGVANIGECAIQCCDSLTGIWVAEDNPNYSSDSYGVLFNKDKTELIYAPSVLMDYVIPNGVTYIHLMAFYDCKSLKNVTIPDSLTGIGNAAFYDISIFNYNTYNNAYYIGSTNNPYHILVKANTTSIKECSIHPDTKIVLYSAFKDCSKLASISIPDGVTSIGVMAFQDCDSLTSVTIGKSVTSINYYAFDGCSKLKDVYYNGTQEQWNSISIGYRNDYLTNATLHLHIHSYDTCSVVTQPTFTSEGSQTKTCSCGESIVESIPQLVGKVKEWNMALGNDLTVNFYLEISDSIVSTAKVQLIQDDRTITAKISDLEKTADGLYKISVHMAATQMNDTIMVMVKNGSDKAPSADYSIRQYCDTLLADESQTAYHALIKEMLNYGAAAQAFFGYESDGAANEGITGAGQTAVPESVPEMSVSGTAGSVRFYGASLVYESKIAVRFYFSGDVSGCKFTVGEQTYTPVAKNGLYYIEVSDILPQNLDETIVVTISSGEDTLTIAYSPLTYIVRMNAKGNETLQNLVCALYNYHLAAKALEAA